MQRLSLVLALCVVAVAQHAYGQGTAVHFLGDWVPASADCASSKLRFRVGETQFTLINGKDEVTYGNVGWPTSYFGPDYQGICAVAIPEVESDDHPFTVYFNVDEKKGVTHVQIAEGEEIPGPGREAWNATIRKHKALNARFPLTSVDLKHCAASKPATAPPAR